MACADASWSSHECEFVPFTAQTRMSGVNMNGNQIRKGAVDAITKYLAATTAVDAAGGAGQRRTDCPLRRHAAGGCRTDIARSA